LLSVGINASPLAAPRTGVGRYIAGLLAALERTAPPDVRCVPLFAPRAAIDRPGGTTARVFALARAVVRRLPAPYELAQAARAAALAARPPTVYHETNHAAPPFGGPVVLTIHDLSTLRFPDTQDATRARHFARALRHGAPRAARVVVPTAAIAAEVVGELGVARERVRVIPFGIDARFGGGGGEANPVGRPYVLYVGALNARKGIDMLVAAWAALPEAVRKAHVLLLVGPREKTAPALGDARWIGYVPDGQLPALYRGAAAFCYPSRYEGFGFPLLEAMACGTPCVASDDPALVEVAAGAAMHSPRGDAQALASALARVLDDSSLRAELSRKGPERAAAFSWERSARSHLLAYREAAS
jgi:alpha-1,3-rhamnosyl/mannosyltransferase